jgi:hypothetical protein
MIQNNDNQVTPMELPGVSPETNTDNKEISVINETTESSSTKALEQGVSATNPVAAQSQGSDLNFGPQPAVTLFYDPSQVKPTQPQPVAASPLIADDNDLIEKEWVEKAKQIVAQTKSDPRKQNIELNKMKAEYLRLRYQKEVKLVEE